MQSERRQTAINLVTGIGALATQMATSFFLSSFVVANLGEASNGFTQLANNLVNYAQLLTLAFNSMGARFMSMSYHRGEMDKVRSYYSTMVTCNIVSAAVLTPLFAYVVVHVDSLFDMGDASLADVQALFTCVFANFLANLFASALSAAAFVRNRVSINNLIGLARTVLNAVLLLCVFSLLPPHIYYVSLVGLLLTMVSLPVFWQVRERLLPETRWQPRRFSVAVLRELVSSGIWNTVNQGGHILMTGLDLVFANWFVGASAMGVLSVAKVVPNAIINLAATVNANFEPSLVMSLSRSGTEGMLGRLRSSIRISNLLLSVPIATFLSFAPVFYALWMPSLDAEQLSWLSFLSIMAYVPWAGLQTLYNVFTATNHLKVNSVAFICSGVVNFIVVCALLAWTDLGTYAIAGVSSTITIVRNLVVTAPYIAHLTGRPWNEYYPDAMRSIASCAFAYAVGRATQVVLPGESWLMLVAGVVIACAASWFTLGMSTLSSSERNQLLRKCKSVVRNRKEV